MSTKCKNAFFYYMMEIKKQQGRSFKSMAEVAAFAGPHWSKLTTEQRKPYEKMARKEKANQPKQTSLGEFIDKVKQDEDNLKKKELSVKDDIKTMVNGAFNKGTILDCPFYLMHFNDFCFSESTKRYYPAEVAICKFSLRNGVKVGDVYHSFINPGSLPLGYAAKAKLQSEQSHHITPPDTFDNNVNTELVLKSIFHYITSGDETSVCPPVYVDEKKLCQVENILENMCFDYNYDNIFRIYPVQYLFHELHNSVVDKARGVWPTITFSQIEIEKDVYSFTAGISCEFHENRDIPIHCSKSIVIRTAYVICVQCLTNNGNIPLIPGQHCPSDCSVEPGARSVSPCSSFESYSSARNTFKMPTESMYGATSDDKSFYYSSESLSMKEERDGSDYQQKGPALTQKKDDIERASSKLSSLTLSETSRRTNTPTHLPFTESAIKLQNQFRTASRGNRGRGRCLLSGQKEN